MGMPTTLGTEWLIIRESSSGSPVVITAVDRTGYVNFGEGPSGLGGSEKTTYGYVLGQRAQANIALRLKAGDSYEPKNGWQVFLYEVTASSQVCVFGGLIDKIETSWRGTFGNRLVSMSCVSWEQIFSVIRVPGRLYSQKTAGFIFNDLLSLATGWPGTVGTINPGVTIDTLLIEGEPTLASIFDQIAQRSGYIWFVNPRTLQINFAPPGLITAPFTLLGNDPLFEEFSFITDEHDFRDRQYFSTDFTQFTESSELFVGDGVSTAFTLRNPVHSVNDAWITRNTQNTATGTLSGLPSSGDTVTIGYPTSGSAYNWAPNSPYGVGYTIIDPANHKQTVSAVSGVSPSGSGFGQSGGTMPTWNDVGGTTNDGGLTWQDGGLLGLGTNVAGVYTFVSVVDNTQYGQVLIGGSAAASLQNLIDAINSKTSTRGIGYSLPTWENPLCNADAPSGSTFTIRNKGAGRSNIASLSKTGSAFSWSATLTSGGITTFNTTTLSVGINSPGVRSSGLSYVVGSAIVNLPSPLNVGTNLEVGYFRTDGNIVGVENTPLVAERALIEGSTGEYQALASAPTQSTPEQTLADAQAALTAFSVIPSTFQFITFHAGLQVGMALSVGFTLPNGPDIRGGGGTTFPGWFGSLVGAFTDSSGNVVKVVNIGNGPALVTVPSGATQLQLGFNDDRFFDNVGSWVITVNGVNHTVLGTSQPWVFTGGINSAYVFGPGGGTSDGTPPVVIGGFTVGDQITLTYVSGTAGPGGSFGPKDANGQVGTPGNLGTPPNVNPAYYGTGANGGSWIIQEVTAELIPSKVRFGPNGGYYRYTVRCIDQAQTGTYLGFWESFGGGGGGGGSAISSAPPGAPPGPPSGPESFAKNGTVVGTQPLLDLIEGSNITLTPVNDPTNGAVRFTINASGGVGGVLLKTNSYTILSTDQGKLITFNSGSAVTATIPAAPPSSPWVVAIENIGAGVLTIARNGNNIDTAAANLTLNQNQGVFLYSDGSAYFTERGMGSTGIGGVNLQATSYTAVIGDNGKLISFNSATPVTLTLPSVAPTSPWAFAVENTGAGVLTVNRNGLNIDGSAANITLNQNQGVWIFSNGTGYYTERGMGSGGGSGLSKYSISFVARTSFTVSHGLGTTDLLCQVYGGITSGWFSSLVGAFTDGSGNVIQVINLGNGPVSLIVPAGASQLQLGVNDTVWFDNTGSWTIAVNGSNHTVLGTAQPWVFVPGGQNTAFQCGTHSDGTAPTVVSGLTAGATVTVSYISGLVGPGGGFGTIYDADGVVGNSGNGTTPPAVQPAFYGTGAGLPYLQVEPESLTITDINNLTITFGTAFTGKAVVIG